jgi:hypothetical protein
MGKYEIIKDIGKVLQQGDNIKLYDSLMKLWDELQIYREKNQLLLEENTKLKKKIDLKKKTSIKKEAIWIDEDENPYCMACYGSKDKFIPLISHSSCYECPVCKQRFNQKNINNFSTPRMVNNAR